MAGYLAELKAEKLDGTRGDVKAEVLVETKADALEVAKSLTLGNTLGDI